MKNFSFYKILLLRLICAIFIFILCRISIEGYLRFLGILPIVVEFFSLYSNIQKRDKIKVKIRFFKKKYVFLLIILSLVFTFPLYIEPIMKRQVEKNKIKLQKLVNDLVKNTDNDVEKTKSILSWFDRSKENIIYLPTKNILFYIYPLYVTFKKPYFCIRIIEHKYPLWTLTSKCGRCAEFSLLFREMANASNLTVRSIHNPGEDHNWDEVLIDGKWVVIDPTRVNLLRNDFGFNYSTHEYESGRNLNISYVFAEYPNGRRKDVSNRYTNLSSITFTLIDQKGNFISNAVIQVISNNLKNKYKNTELNCTTNDKGQCSLSIGGGNYELIAKTNDFIPLYKKSKMIIEENRKYNRTLILEKKILGQNVILPYQIFSIIKVPLLWFFIVCYLELKK